MSWREQNILKKEITLAIIEDDFHEMKAPLFSFNRPTMCQKKINDFKNCE